MTRNVFMNTKARAATSNILTALLPMAVTEKDFENSYLIENQGRKH